MTVREGFFKEVTIELKSKQVLGEKGWQDWFWQQEEQKLLCGRRKYGEHTKACVAGAESKRVELDKRGICRLC